MEKRQERTHDVKKHPKKRVTHERLKKEPHTLDKESALSYIQKLAAGRRNSAMIVCSKLRDKTLLLEKDESLWSKMTATDPSTRKNSHFTAKDRRRMGLHNLKNKKISYKECLALNTLWSNYALSVLGTDL
jgi:hypothetical protein